MPSNLVVCDLCVVAGIVLRVVGSLGQDWDLINHLTLLGFVRLAESGGALDVLVHVELRTELLPKLGRKSLLSTAKRVFFQAQSGLLDYGKDSNIVRLLAKREFAEDDENLLKFRR